jgi:phosphatidate cytidylyltransferase
MMGLVVFNIIVVYFLIGAIGIFLIKRKGERPAGDKQWLKYFVYLLIVSAVVISIEYNIEFKSIVLFIMIMGLYEIVSVWLNNTDRKTAVMISSLIIYFLFCFAFYKYASINEGNEKLFVYILIFTFDGFSQVTGQLFGKHHFAPKLSPNKTTEGLIGGLITTIITAIILYHWLKFSFTTVMIISIVVCIAGLAGDLLASYYKRLNKIKDYGNFITGHGGILDRFDSFIVAGSTYWLITICR